MKKGLKRRLGDTLVEILTALGVLGVIIPTSLDAFGVVFMAEVFIHERVAKASSAEWWFNQLEFPVSPADVGAAPQTDGRMRFRWETTPGAHDTLEIILYVSNGALSDAPYKESRVY
jgi:hypothetical protein